MRNEIKTWLIIIKNSSISCIHRKQKKRNDLLHKSFESKEQNIILHFSYQKVIVYYIIFVYNTQYFHNFYEFSMMKLYRYEQSC